jgi:hypothetical protein
MVAPSIRVRAGGSDVVVEHRPKDGTSFTVRDLAAAVEETERQGAGAERVVRWNSSRGEPETARRSRSMLRVCLGIRRIREMRQARFTWSRVTAFLAVRREPKLLDS